ncbi:MULTISPECIES: DUF1802 family protein [Moorena]|uniref:DUF1802 family protein n=1 Tax=Moorena producens 3L TaxID=489825 RepID=F4XMW7_9CYAN|nr:MULTISPECIES: DUF1802 family protein [Moorena]EGJ34026.1 protein of unknown function, DUF1802 [Moorena producens 3L]NEP30051.1 DUF1802 family protein [Moorena sp. SIO3B2]NEP65507.1 DUF1802 family protein [Moorena sp. SIO3A5]NER85625.1 DUF1802 family protein [Moorena sp. SIO3A2]NES41376.1 DUF1802 family protein [Moorena sp. SIO2C4]
MSQQDLISIALLLPAPDIEALIQGRMIAAIPQLFINPGRKFVLYPSKILTNKISRNNPSSHCLYPEQYYRSSFREIAQKSLTALNSETVLIKAWARCELCQHLKKTESLEKLSLLTVWTAAGLQARLEKQQGIFLAYLRVYQLPKVLEVPRHDSISNIRNTTSQPLGKFVSLGDNIRVTDDWPVLSDRIFSQRRHQLENRLPPLYPELEELQSQIANLAITNPAAKALDEEIKKFIGWSSNKQLTSSNPDLAWINTIAALGNRSKELDQGKTNYQAGTDFENIVRDSLKFLGFTIDHAHKGGAGGLDLFCSKPYPLVGECKAGKKIPNDTAVQLLNLGTLRLNNQELLNKTAKLIIGPGEPTKQLMDAAIVHGMAIINPETLQKLVKLQSQYPNSVDLIILKDYLIPGQADQEVEKYINHVSEKLKLRSHIVQLVKKLIDDRDNHTVGVEMIYGAYNFSNPPQSLTQAELHEILIELSSPLTGYLGRIKETDSKSDCFYFLRDLPMD